ncbi:MAG TPA: DUF4886 domain-containing protein [Usitatibacter sp.]|nr:DUF4886 domain-containing protein [Usitatibacter sp.]
MRIARLALAVASLVALAALAATPQPVRTKIDGEPVASILWVGNSFFFYNNGIHNMITAMSKAARHELRSTLAAIGGSGIDWHDVDGYLKPGSRMGYYSIIDNKVRLNKAGRQYDTMVVMDCSQCPIHPELGKIFHEYAKIDADTARKYGVRPVFFMSWAYKDKPEMTAQLAEAYTREANANDALVIPAGLAFARAIERRPDLELYQADKRHPQRIGTYLAACTAFAALTGLSPVGNAYTAGIDNETAAFLQAVAWDTVREYYEGTHPGLS